MKPKANLTKATFLAFIVFDDFVEDFEPRHSMSKSVTELTLLH